MVTMAKYHTYEHNPNRCYSVASGVKDELTVTVDTDDVSLASFENACFHT